jgi:hypothetical protein
MDYVVSVLTWTLLLFIFWSLSGMDVFVAPFRCLVLYFRPRSWALSCSS